MYSESYPKWFLLAWAQQSPVPSPSSPKKQLPKVSRLIISWATQTDELSSLSKRVEVKRKLQRLFQTDSRPQNCTTGQHQNATLWDIVLLPLSKQGLRILPQLQSGRSRTFHSLRSVAAADCRLCGPERNNNTIVYSCDTCMTPLFLECRHWHCSARCTVEYTLKAIS